MKSAVTISLVPEAKGGPFVFWDNLAESCAEAARLGFDAVEIFPTSAEALDVAKVRGLLHEHHLRLAAIGTGAGWVKHKLRLTDPDAEIRQRARDFAAGIIAVAGESGAPAIIGSMQGRTEPGVDRAQSLQWLGESLEALAGVAGQLKQNLLFEPLNRYETDLFNRQADAATFLKTLGAKNIRVLCDLFHMNLEERSIPDALREVGPLVGHVHWADSNRRAVGLGHTDMEPVVEALYDISYTGYLSAEVLPIPDSVAAARLSRESIRRWIEAAT